MNIVNEMTDCEVLREMGSRFAATRISLRMTQAELARRAGVSKRSIERLEAGEGGVRLQIAVAATRVIRRLNGMNALIPDVKLSPFDISQRTAALPKRVRSRKRPVSRIQWKE